MALAKTLPLKSSLRRCTQWKLPHRDGPCITSFYISVDHSSESRIIVLSDKYFMFLIQTLGVTIENHKNGQGRGAGNYDQNLQWRYHRTSNNGQVMSFLVRLHVDRAQDRTIDSPSMYEEL